MKKAKKSLKSVALFMAGLILLQSCSTYKTPVTLQQAAQEEKAVKIVTIDDDTYKYKYIVYEDGQFYGVKDNPGEDVKFPITVEEVEEVLMKNGGIPWWAWILIVIGGFFVVLITVYLIDDSAYGF
ncbi:hypothetical protein [Lentiprolixibacter aurantiacus]|uniref:DUF3592 domain-containing protein n=1 Tax=Lentiprolixibacter aurantiacus TaxID=2993939 RepID=A0AAE3MLB6_9FLAO|nr:hypothetical protein [Lentiprolixibacter aurantiacus]MCX2719077.1 hypothetical protein [Lentiprolixibacter aurantiacus]